MANGPACSCPACRIGALCVPLLIIGLGALFSLDVVWKVWPFWKTWPALLILWGLCRLMERLAPDTGHGQPPAPPAEGGHYAA